MSPRRRGWLFTRWTRPAVTSIGARGPAPKWPRSTIGMHPKRCIPICIPLAPRTATHPHARRRLATRNTDLYGQVRGANPDGPYWARTSDLRLVETVPYAPQIGRNTAPHAPPRRIGPSPDLVGFGAFRRGYGSGGGSLQVGRREQTQKSPKMREFGPRELRRHRPPADVADVDRTGPRPGAPGKELVCPGDPPSARGCMPR